MTAKKNLEIECQEIECRATKPEDKIFLALCCSHKNLTAKPVEDHGDGPSLTWSGNHVVGAAAICLVLEAAIPEPSLFPNGNIGMPIALLHWMQSMKNTTARNTEYLTANSHLISRQLGDGRPFLQGSSLGLADICAASWCLLCKNLFAGDQTLAAWISRMEKAVIPFKNNAENQLVTPENLQRDKQYQGFMNFTFQDGVTIITSPLDGTLMPSAASS